MTGPSAGPLACQSCLQHEAELARLREAREEQAKTIRLLLAEVQLLNAKALSNNGK